jgi:nucleoside-diphosphate-sugar epimerase
LASRLASGKSAYDTSILFDNIRMAESVVEIAKVLQPGKVIHFSSMSVYPDRTGKYNESSLVIPSFNNDCLYGLSKFCCENILDFYLRGRKISVIHLRIAQVYGEGMRQDRVMPAMLKELREKNIITVFGNGKRMTNFIHVKKLLPVVDRLIKNNYQHVLNVGDEQLSFLVLARRLIREYGNKNSRIIKKSKGSKEKFYLDTAKLDKLLSVK